MTNLIKQKMSILSGVQWLPVCVYEVHFFFHFLISSLVRVEIGIFNLHFGFKRYETVEAFSFAKKYLYFSEDTWNHKIAATKYQNVKGLNFFSHSAASLLEVLKNIESENEGSTFKLSIQFKSMQHAWKLVGLISFFMISELLTGPIQLAYDDRIGLLVHH